jgi:hypothetical protein
MKKILFISLISVLTNCKKNNIDKLEKEKFIFAIEKNLNSELLADNSTDKINFKINKISIDSIAEVPKYKYYEKKLAELNKDKNFIKKKSDSILKLSDKELATFNYYLYEAFETQSKLNSKKIDSINALYIKSAKNDFFYKVIFTINATINGITKTSQLDDIFNEKYEFIDR